MSLPGTCIINIAVRLTNNITEAVKHVDIIAKTAGVDINAKIIRIEINAKITLI